jgi:hypothetical protein
MNLSPGEMELVRFPVRGDNSQLPGPANVKHLSSSDPARVASR